jgi:ferric-dicitrate binding protein FerR (iron transport regulator)
MKEITPGTAPVSCEMAHRIYESTLVARTTSVEQREILQTHLDSCESCKNVFEFSDAFHALAELLDESDFVDGISAVLSQRRQQKQVEEQNPIRWPRLAAGIAIAAVLCAGVWWVWQSVGGPVPSSATGPCEAASITRPIAGVSMTRCTRDAAPEVAVIGGEVTVKLTHGAVALSVDPNRQNPHPVSVDTPKGRVAVKGTLFTVHADNFGAQVEVLRGVVTVTPQKSPWRSLSVAAGNVARIDSGDIYPLQEPAFPVLTAALSRQHDSTESAAALARTSGSPQDDNREDAGKNAQSLPDGVSPASRHATGVKNGASPLGPSEKTMEALIASARECLIAHDWECAAERYAKVVKNHGHRPGASSVLISLAKLELRRLGSPEKALKHYRAYMLKEPGGPLAEEALLGIAKSHRKIGNTDAERKALQQLLEQFPRSSMAVKVQNRLAQLNGEERR